MGLYVDPIFLRGMSWKSCGNNSCDVGIIANFQAPLFTAFHFHILFALLIILIVTCWGCFVVVVVVLLFN